MRLMQPPEIRYATSTGGVDIAWQELGDPDGPCLVFVLGFISHLELNREFPPFVNYLEPLIRHCRILAFDKRGTGLSARSLGYGSVAERTDDVRAVMDAAGWDRASLFGISEGGPISLLFAATYPERVERLVLYGTMSRIFPGDGYPYGDASLDRERSLSALEHLWGTGRALEFLFQHAPDAAITRPILARFERNACTPRMAAEIMRRNYEIDVREALSSISVPTLVMHCAGDPALPVEHGRYIAEHVNGARFVEIDNDFHGSWIASDYEPITTAAVDFVAGARERRREAERVLATVLFTDIVRSTERAAASGDRWWRELLDRHDREASVWVERFGGRLVKQTGDGMLATFDGPARAVACATQLAATMTAIGLPIRAGLHTGEIERRGDDIGGLAVHIAARVAGLADTGEVLVSRTVRDLVVGSDLTFEDRGSHELKGVPEPWQVYEAVP
jgi:class 3 adenylate cyclase